MVVSSSDSPHDRPGSSFALLKRAKAEPTAEPEALAEASCKAKPKPAWLERKEWHELQEDWRAARQQVYADYLRKEVMERKRGSSKYGKELFDQLWKEPLPGVIKFDDSDDSRAWDGLFFGWNIPNKNG